MKKQFFYSMLAAAALLTSCSSESNVTEGGNGILADGEGYVSLSINLPTRAASSRAANDVFDDGTANEYAVKDAVLVLFEGANEADAVVSTAYNLNLSFNLDTPANDNITSTAKIVQKIKDPLAGGYNFYALVILNNNGQLVINPADNSLTVNSVAAAGKKLSQFIADFKLTNLSTTKLLNGTIDEDGAAATDFLMANAPLYTSVGGATSPTGDVMTLPVIDAAHIYESAAVAASNPAVEISVERAVAKVTVRTATSFAMNTTNTTTPLPIKTNSIEWHLNNTNTQSFLVRNVAGYKTNWSTLKSNATGIGKPYRFVGDDVVTTGLFRTYWGIDPNYTGMADGAGMKYWNGINSTKPIPVTWITPGTSPAFGHPSYCAENTFDVPAQKDINTTAAVIKAVFNNGATFYTINNAADKPADLLTQANMELAVKNSFITNVTIANAMKTARPGTWTIDLSNPSQAAKVIVELKNDAKAGVVGIKEITVQGSLFGGVDGTDDIKATTLDIGSGVYAIATVNAANTIRRYLNGVAYYRVLLKHFGDDLTPWKSTETPAVSAGDIYPSTNQAANYLGRYGVVRNNWYDIEVEAIKNLGTPTPSKLGNTITPDNPNDPTPDPDEPGDGGYDDDIDEYISVKINILSWAKRTQSVTL